MAKIGGSGKGTGKIKGSAQLKKAVGTQRAMAARATVDMNRRNANRAASAYRAPSKASGGSPDAGQALRNSNPIDALFNAIGENIKKATGQK